jgi:putative MATE family efflux protein
MASPWLVSLFGASEAVAEQADTYLAISMWGLPAMLIVFAATGLLRGMQDTVTPLWIAGLGFAANALLNWLFIYGWGWGIAGSAAGTVTAQWGMVAAYVVVIGRLARRHSASVRPQRDGVRGSARSGGWLFLRTVSLRVALLATVGVATGIGTTELAGWQVVFTIFSAAAFALDALAIAAQALIGKGLGAGDERMVRRVLARTVAWGAWFGVIVGVLIGGLSAVIGLAFTGDAEVAALIQPALIVLAVAQPVAGVVFVLDGVLMGAGDARYLAIAGGLNLVPFIPALWIIAATGVDGTAGVTWLSVAFFGVYLLARLVTLGWRVRTGRWLTANV